MDNARKVLDWDAQFDVAIDPEKPEDTDRKPSQKRKTPALCAVTSAPLKYEQDNGWRNRQHI